MCLLKYSLWLMPTGAVANKFSQIILQLAEAYSTPKFPPHVTLIGSIEAHKKEIITKMQDLALQIHPFTIKLTVSDYTDYYYRALFIRVEPSVDVLTAHQKAQKIFPGIEADYMPHLSLLYGNFSVETKKQMIEKIGNKFTDVFEANTLHLYLTNGDVSTWHEIKEIPLQRK